MYSLCHAELKGYLLIHCFTHTTHSARNILNLASHRNSRIRELRCIRPYLDSKTANTIAASVVYSKLDYCNSVLQSPKSQIDRLEQIQNCLDRNVVKAPKFSFITPILRSPNWLKINEVDFRR